MPKPFSWCSCTAFYWCDKQFPVFSAYWVPRCSMSFRNTLGLFSSPVLMGHSCLCTDRVNYINVISFYVSSDTKIHMQGFLYLFSGTFVDTLQYSLWTVKIFHALWLQQVFCKSCSWLYLLKPVFDRLTAIWNLYLTQMLHLTVEWFWKLTNNLNLFKHPWLFFPLKG